VTWGSVASLIKIKREVTEGVLEPTAVAMLNESLASSAASLATYLVAASGIRDRGR
jgi:hypothetical protein